MTAATYSFLCVLGLLASIAVILPTPLMYLLKQPLSRQQNLPPQSPQGDAPTLAVEELPQVSDALLSARVSIDTTSHNAESSKPLPNIVMITVDGMTRLIGHLNIGPFNVPTPNMDALAAKGVSFANAHCCSPACRPSRACLLFSLSPKVTGVRTNHNEWEENPEYEGKENLVAYLNRAGYRTVTTGRLFHRFANAKKYFKETLEKATVASGYELKVERFTDASLGRLDFGTVDRPLDKTKEWDQVQWTLNQLKRDEDMEQPGFYSIGLDTCHYRMEIPKAAMDMLPDDPAQPPRPDDDFDDIPLMGRGYGKFSRRQAEIVISDPRLASSYVKHNYGCIKTVDLAIRPLLDYIYSAKKETIVILTADHGFHLLDKHRMSKFTLWPQSTQVPLIVYGGPFKGGKIVQEPVSLGDIYPSLADVVGQKLRYKLAGESFVGLVNGGKRGHVSSYFKNDSKAVITSTWHLIVYGDQSVELYDRVKDPWALNNLADEMPDVVAELREKEMR